MHRSTHQFQAPAADRVTSRRLGLMKAGRIELRSAITEFKREILAEQFDRDPERLVRIPAERVINDIASAFLESQTRLEQLLFAYSMAAPKLFQLFHRAHHFFRCGSQSQCHRDPPSTGPFFLRPALKMRIAMSSDWGASPTNSLTFSNKRCAINDADWLALPVKSKRMWSFP